MSKKDYSKDPSGRKQFSIDHIKFHDAEAAQDFFGCAKKSTPPHAHRSQKKRSAIFRNVRAKTRQHSLSDLLNPTLSRATIPKPATAAEEKKKKIADAESAPRKLIALQAMTAIRTEAGQAVRTAPMTEATALPTTVPCRIRTICN